MKPFRALIRLLTGTKLPRDVLLDLLPKHSIGAEIGVHHGDFSKKILAIVKPKKLFLVDPWAYEEGEKYKRTFYGGEKGQDQAHMDDRYRAVLSRFSKNIDAGQVCVIRETAERAFQEMDDNSLDWVYIDGNHAYDFVKKDLELSFLAVRPSGIISGDDYTSGGWWKDDVKQAVEEFVRDKKLQTVKIIDNQFLLIKSDI